MGKIFIIPHSMKELSHIGEWLQLKKMNGYNLKKSYQVVYQ